MTDISTKVTTPQFRASYANVFIPKAATEGSEKKYSISMIFPKDTDISKLKAAVKQAITNKWGNKKPRNLRLPFRDGDDEQADDEAYANSIFVNANSKQKPGIVDTHLNPILTEEEFGSGDYARATVVFAAYDVSGNKGVGCYLHNIQKIKDGERLGGKVKAENDFAVVDDDDDENDDDFLD
jgi:hypothetical protein